MAELNPTREETEEIYSYNVLVSRFEDESEQRRAVSTNGLIGLRIRSPNLTRAQMEVIRNFYIAKTGELTSFTVENPFDQTEYTMRFEGPMRIRFRGGVFQCTYELRRVFNT